MTAPTEAQVREAIATLESSYTYDPPERWRPAYDLLSNARRTMDTTADRYRWLSSLGLIAFAGLAILTFVLLFTRPVGDQFFSVALFAMVTIPAALNYLTTLLTKSRFPLLKLKHDLDDACRKFDEMVTETEREKDNVSA